MMSIKYDVLYKLLVVGDSGVGKSCILLRFTDDTFPSSMSFMPSTIGIDFKIKTIRLRDKTVKLQIWDTAGAERFHTITTAYYRNAMGVIFVYDITKAKSFENIPAWLNRVKKESDPEVERMILANKCDREEERVISTETGQSFASQHNIKFLETSSVNGDNIEQAFIQLSESLLDKFPEGINLKQLSQQESREKGEGSGKCCNQS